MLVPMMRARVSAVKPDSSSAAGTLLVTWLASTATGTSRPAMIRASQAEKAGTRPRLPMNTKKAAKVRSSE